MPSTVNRSQAAMSSAMTPEAFALLGADSLAYVRALRSEDVGFLHADAPLLAPGSIVYVLHAADGSPLVIAASLETAVTDAATQRLDAVSVH